MIITQTPLRISLFGGGTDFREFYEKEDGAALSLGLDKYVYAIVKERFDDKIYVKYSKNEIVDNVEEIQHDLVRETMKKTGVKGGVEIVTLADVPSEGSGLASSSSITVGLLNAFYTYKGEQITQDRLAREACEIEIDILKKPMGVQDQCIAAYGNLRFFEFKRDSITVERLKLSEEEKRRLVSNLLLFYTNRTRSSSAVLMEQKHNISSRLSELRKIKTLAFTAKETLLAGRLDDIGGLLDEGWQTKKRLASNVSNPDIDALYKKALKAGATGGKISGAGNGGFLLLYCPRGNQNSLRNALKGYRELPFLLSRDGSKAIFNIRGYEWR